jgi:hypothetical protein
VFRLCGRGENRGGRNPVPVSELRRTCGIVSRAVHFTHFRSEIFAASADFPATCRFLRPNADSGTRLAFAS